MFHDGELRELDPLHSGDRLIATAPVKFDVVCGVAVCQEREAGTGRLFLSNDTHLGQLERGVHTRGPGRLDPAGPARDPVPAVAAAPPGQAGPTGPFCRHTRARPSDSLPQQPAQTFMFWELAGRHRKLGAPCPLRGAAWPPRRVPRPGAQWHGVPRATRCHLAPALSGSGPRVPGPQGAETGLLRGTRSPRVLWRGRRTCPGAGTGASAVQAGTHPQSRAGD